MSRILSGSLELERRSTTFVLETADRYHKRTQIIAYIAPKVSLLATKFALVFGTRHGVLKFAEEILSLYRACYFTDIIISGGMTGHDTKSEASVLYEALLACGVPAGSMVVEEKAMNTGQNVAFTREIVGDIAIKKLFLIGKIASKRRYLMTVRKQWPEITNVCCHGVNYFSSPAERGGRTKNSEEGYFPNAERFHYT